jgi:hypothetical protein
MPLPVASSRANRIVFRAELLDKVWKSSQLPTCRDRSTSVLQMEPRASARVYAGHIVSCDRRTVCPQPRRIPTNLSFRASLFASAIALSFLPLVVSMTPSIAQEEVVSFRAFHRALADHGDWVYSDRWGEVWVPSDVPDDFHPYYTGGHWADTDEYGWLWVSDYDWGDIAFHYGRWVNDPDDGWMWIPGYVWSPGWVVWRSNGHYTGWMPMPPDEGFLNGNGDTSSFGVSINFNRTNDYYGYSRWYGRGYDENRFALNWVFIGTGNLSDRDYRSHAVSRTNIVNVIHSTRNVTNYTVVNNYVVNRSIDVKIVEHAGGRPVHAVPAATVIKTPALITTANTGRGVQVRMRETQPRGTGIANSAPRPSQEIVGTLSTRPVEHNGRPPVHLFTQTTVVNAPLKPATTTPTTPATVPAVGATPSGSNVTPHRGTTGPNTAVVAPLKPATTLPPTTATMPAASPPSGGSEMKPRHGGTMPTAPVNGTTTVTPPGAAVVPLEHKPGGGGTQAGPNASQPANSPNVVPKSAEPHVVPPSTMSPAATNPETANPGSPGDLNRNRHKTNQEGEGASGQQGGSATPPAQAGPSFTQPPAANSSNNNSGSNRDRLKGGQGNQGLPSGAAAPSSTQMAPEATPSAVTTPHLEKGVHDRGVGTPVGTGSPLPVKASPTTAPAQVSPAPDKGKDHTKKKDVQDNQVPAPSTP